MKSLLLSKPHMIVVVGIPGAGKSWFADKFSKMFNVPHIDHAFYHNLASSTRAGNEIIDDVTEKMFAAKQTMIIEGLGSRRRDRLELAQVARKRGYKLLFVWVQLDQETAALRRGRKLSRSEFNELVKKFQPLERSEPHVVVSGMHTYQTQAKVVLKKLVTERAPAPMPAPVENIRRKAFFRGRIMG